MSYILDALRKADAERERGHVPGIHAQPSFGGPAPTRAQRSVSPAPWLAAGGLAVLVVGAVAWFALGSPRPPAEAPSPVPIVAAPSLSPAPAPANAPATAQAPPPAPGATVPAVARTADAPALQGEVPRPRAQQGPAVRTPKAAASAASAASAALVLDGKPGATGEKVYAIAELPDDIRRQLPALSIGGSMYSPKPADRILIINGQVLHEGERIAPDLLLVQIRVKAALLNFKGYRYVVAF